MDFSNFETFIFDLDGTIWNWVKLYHGAKETIAKLKQKGKKVLFVTNNSLYSKAGLVKRLKKLGVNVKESELITSTIVAAEYLKSKRATAFPVGKGVAEELRRYGIKIKSKPEYVVVGHDTNFNMRKLEKIYRMVEDGAEIIAVAAGRVWTVGEKLYPATGCILAAIEFATQKKSLFVGKPSDEMARKVQAVVKSDKSKVAIFGDECGADISMGKKLGYFTVLVRTGVDKVCNITPDAVIDGIKSIEV